MTNNTCTVHLLVLAATLLHPCSSAVVLDNDEPSLEDDLSSPIMVMRIYVPIGQLQIQVDSDPLSMTNQKP